MKVKDISAALAADRETVFAIDLNGSGNRLPSRAYVQAVGLPRSGSSRSDGAKIKTLDARERYGRTLPAGAELTIATQHVLRVWTDSDEEARLRRIDGERVKRELEMILTTYGLAEKVGYPWGVRVGYGERAAATVDAHGLSRLLAVFATSDKAEHYVLAVLVLRGDENAKRVVEDMDPIELLRYRDVFGMVA